MHPSFRSPSRRHCVLPNEPRVVDTARQQQLTERFLLPQLAEVAAFFLALRAQVDDELAPRQPVKLGKPYPLGQCLEISIAAEQRLKSMTPAQLPSAAACAGHAAYLAFRRAGGILRQVWGDLRGEFFQNAFQLGSLYLDVSNDTVTPSKPKVEILPFAEARFVAIRDYQHFSQLARRYWKVQVYPNHLLPELAPYCPLLWIFPDGRLMLGDVSAYMVSLTQASRFQSSEQVLATGTLPDALFYQAQQVLRGHPQLASDPASGRRQALQACRALRRKFLPPRGPQVSRIIRAAQDINRQLAQAAAAPTGQPPLAAPVSSQGVVSMNAREAINIDGQQYALAGLSDQARQQLQMLQLCEERVRELQRDLAITQTARNAYAQALKTLLPQT